jgi:hypothetical protein
VLSTPLDIESIGARPIPEFDGVHKVWPRGDRLEAVRSAAAAFKERFKAQGEVLAARSVDIAAAPYPVKFAFHGAATAPTVPYISIINRMVVVQFHDWEGVLRNLVWEPTVPAGSNEAPFYHQNEQRISQLPGGRWLAHNVFTKYYHEIDDVLRICGLRPEDVDYASFDHLHVQDLRMIVGTTEPMPGESSPRPPAFPNAKFIIQRKEVGTFESTHPMQWAWYVDGGMSRIIEDGIVLIDGDIELGPGVALVWTPGHTDGNHSLCLNTPDGVWVSSENGVALDNWQPELSRIPGIRRYHSFYRREIVPNANTLVDSIDQYDSMVKEKTLADPCTADPRWLQILPSSELAPWKRQWPVIPTHVHGGINYGTLASPHAASGNGTEA